MVELLLSFKGRMDEMLDKAMARSEAFANSLKVREMLAHTHLPQALHVLLIAARYSIPEKGLQQKHSKNQPCVCPSFV